MTIGWSTTDRTEQIDVSAIPLYTEVKGGVIVIDEDGNPTGALDAQPSKPGKEAGSKEGAK